MVCSLPTRPPGHGAIDLEQCAMKPTDKQASTSKRARQQQAGMLFGAEPDRSREAIRVFEKRPTRSVERTTHSKLFS